MLRVLVLLYVASLSVAGPAVALRHSGQFSILTYNVAGLPEGVSHAHPGAATRLMGPLLNAYDLVVVQEDFTYDADLAAGTKHPYHIGPGAPVLDMGDGLARFSRLPYVDHVREAWKACHGFWDAGHDCMTRKGFDRATHILAPGFVVDVYDVHLDAGRRDGDRRARAAQVEQLLAAIRRLSAGRAVIVAGDTNMRAADAENLARLLDGAGLTDSCRALSCGDEQRIDRVLFRSGGGVTLTPRAWQLHRDFVDASGRALSDHAAVAVELRYKTGT